MNDDNEVEWFTICDEKNIILKKNDNNVYKITLDVDIKNNEDTVLNILKNGQLFDLLFALNPDVIDKFDIIEQNDIHNVFITFKNCESTHDKENNDGEDDKVVRVFFALKYTFKENKCIIESQEESHDELTHSSCSEIAKIRGQNDFISVSKIKLKATEKVTENNKKTFISLTFKVRNKKSSNIINMYIGLYFKKIFYRFKQYFE